MRGKIGTSAAMAQAAIKNKTIQRELRKSKFTKLQRFIQPMWSTLFDIQLYVWYSCQILVGSYYDNWTKKNDKNILASFCRISSQQANYNWVEPTLHTLNWPINLFLVKYTDSSLRTGWSVSHFKRSSSKLKAFPCRSLNIHNNIRMRL